MYNIKNIPEQVKLITRKLFSLYPFGTLDIIKKINQEKFPNCSLIRELFN